MTVNAKIHLWKYICMFLIVFIIIDHALDYAFDEYMDSRYYYEMYEMKD